MGLQSQIIYLISLFGILTLFLVKAIEYWLNGGEMSLRIFKSRNVISSVHFHGNWFPPMARACRSSRLGAARRVLNNVDIDPPLPAAPLYNCSREVILWECQNSKFKQHMPRDLKTFRIMEAFLGIFKSYV